MRPQQTWKEGIQKILKERAFECNRVRTVTQDHDRLSEVKRKEVPLIYTDLCLKQVFEIPTLSHSTRLCFVVNITCDSRDISLEFVSVASLSGLHSVYSQSQCCMCISLECICDE